MYHRQHQRVLADQQILQHSSVEKPRYQTLYTRNIRVVVVHLFPLAVMQLRSMENTEETRAALLYASINSYASFVLNTLWYMLGYE